MSPISSNASKNINSGTTFSRRRSNAFGSMRQVTSPASAVKYVATISAGKQPGEIDDPSGLRNDEFDQGLLKHIVKYAYEIRKLEALPNTFSSSEMKRNGWLNDPPQKCCYVKESMKLAVGALRLTLVFDSASGPLSEHVGEAAAPLKSSDEAEPEQEPETPGQM